MRPSYWVPPILWMVLILWLASDTGSAERTGRFLLPVLRAVFPGASPLQLDAMHAGARKLAHAMEYAILAGLWLRAWARGAGIAGGEAAWRAWVTALAWAVVDESYQSTVGSRTGSAVDVLIDAAGALAAAIPGAMGWRRAADRLTRSALWIAAVGGAALLAINLLLGVASGVLWVTVPAAVLALVLLRRPPTP